MFLKIIIGLLLFGWMLILLEGMVILLGGMVMLLERLLGCRC